METWIGGQRVKEIYINGQSVRELYKGGVKIFERADPAPTVEIGTQTWMAVNLGVPGQTETPGYGRFYDYASQEPFAGAGKLYSWQEAVEAAALFPGWHLPTSDEWQTLINFVDGTNYSTPQQSATAGGMLKSASEWADNGGGTDEFGFSALPGGYAKGDNFNNVGHYGNWWTATENGHNIAYSRFMFSVSDYANPNSDDKSNGFSVRLVQD